MSGILFTQISEINSKSIKKIVAESASRRKEMQKLYSRYKGEVPILTRKYRIDNEEQQCKINNKLANDFFSEIVDMKVGFLCGVPVSYVVDKSEYSEQEYIEANDTIQTFNKQNIAPDIDAETAKQFTICGVAGRLFYFDENADIKMSVINPWELSFVGDDVENPKTSLRIYEKESINSKGEEIEIYCVDVYDNTTVYNYERKEDEPEYALISQSSHQFSYVPLIGVSNNAEMIGDAEKVITLIDGYDRTLSDINSELEQFRLAYLAVYGAEITQQILDMVKRTGAFSLPQDAKLEFVNKSISDVVVENHMDRIERNIYRFSKTPNMNDISFSGNITGVAMKYKFKSFEDKCKTAELKFTKALTQQYKILCDVWATRGVSIDPMDVDFVFTRNYPQNLLEEMQLLQLAKGLVTEETAYGLVSFIKDPSKEVEAFNEQQSASLDSFMANQDKTPQDNTKSEETQSQDEAANVQG